MCHTRAHLLKLQGPGHSAPAPHHPLAPWFVTTPGGPANDSSSRWGSPRSSPRSPPPSAAQTPGPSDRSLLAQTAPDLFTDLGRVQDGFAPGLGGAQSRTLDLVLRHSHPRSARIVGVPAQLAARRAFTFGYSSESGLSAGLVPADGGQLLAVLDDLVDLDEGYAWVGRLYVAASPEDALGTISLVYRPGVGVSGEIQVRTDLYTIEPLDARTHVLVDVDEGQLIDGLPGAEGTPYRDGPAGPVATEARVWLPPTSEPSVAGPTAGPSSPDGPVGEASSSTTARVLVLYTAAAASAVPSIDNVVNQVVTNSNTAYGRSATSPRLQLAHKQLLSGFSAGSSSTVDVDTRLPNNATVQSLRDTHKADLVVLLVRPNAYPVYDPFGNLIGYVYGEAKEIFKPGSATNAADAFAVVDVSQAVLNKTFTHEVGHLQGAQHHPDDATTTERGYSYGRGHREKWAKCIFGWICGYNRFSTIMAYTENGSYPRVQNISNPDVEEQGRDTGTSSRDNARALDNSATTVSLYRPNPLAASISGPGLLTPLEFGSWTANPSGATYRWYRNGSFTGVTSRTYTETAGYSDFSLRVDVTLGAETASASRYVTVFDNGGCDPDIILCPIEAPVAPAPAAAVAVPDAFALRGAGPNPFQTSTGIAFDVPEASAVTVAVYDALGREVARLVDRPMAAGSHLVRLDGTDLAPGVYVVRMRAGTFTSVHEVTLAR